MDGIIVVNKSRGCTSHDVVYKIKKITGEKVGHTGTLDPNATGVLPLLIGKATLLSKYLINHDKTYEVKLKLGKKTSTADGEGKIIETKKVDNNQLETDNVKKILNSFIGEQQQIPPIYSAIKINGKKLYEYARNGEKVEISPRHIEIYNINLYDIDKTKNEIIFEVSCSKGTYIRSLCEDIADSLNTVGYMKELKRIQVGDFNINNSITIDEIERAKDARKIIEKSLIDFESVFKDKKNIKLNNLELKKFFNGVKTYNQTEDGVYKIYNELNVFIGTGVVVNNYLKRDIVLKNIENI